MEISELSQKLRAQLSPEQEALFDSIITLYDEQINRLLSVNGELEAEIKGLNEQVEKLDHEIGALQQEYDALFLELREVQQGIGNIRGY